MQFLLIVIGMACCAFEREEMQKLLFKSLSLEI